ncbi:hypothetical protein R5R35_005078 [Gryllus longicercus]|uniref:Large ribosomal subunit protein uL10m n=1 Tax=Gryllus longicercus TaxID=2509291 RepID=A0AAN9V7Y5_9ORTH
MSSLTQALLQVRWQPSIQFVRYRRINIQKPRPPHYVRKLVLHVCEPQYEKPKKSIQELCLRPVFLTKKQKVEENPFQTLLARDLVNWCEKSNCIYIFQQNSITGPDIFKAKVLFKRQQMALQKYDRPTMEEAFSSNDKYKALLPLIVGSPLSLAFGSEPQVSTVLKICRKVPELILLAGIFDNRLLSRSEMMEYTYFPNLQTAQAQLVSVLNSAATQLVQNMNQHQQTLVGHLEKHVELKSEDK